MQTRNLTPEALYENVRREFGPELCAIMDRPGWTDLMINPQDNDVVRLDMGEKVTLPCRFDRNSLMSAALLIAAYYGLPFNPGEAQILEAVIPVAWLRAEFVRPPAVSALSLVFRRPSDRVFTMDEMLSFGTITPSQVEFLRDAIDTHKNIVVAGGTGCHAKGTMVIMADGSMKAVEDIAIGDAVMGDDGTPRKVLELHHGSSRMYRLSPEIGKPCTVNEDHVLALVSKSTGERSEMPLPDYLLLSPEKRSDFAEYYSAGIPSFGDAERRLSEKKGKIPPYIYGFIVGRAAASTASPEYPMLIFPLDPERDDRKGRSEDEFCSWEKEREERTDGFLRLARTGRGNRKGLAVILHPDEYWYFTFSREEKNYTVERIPDEYLRGSWKDRFDFLAGIIDSSFLKGQKAFRNRETEDKYRELSSIAGHENVSFSLYGPYLPPVAAGAAFIASSLGFYTDVIPYFDDEEHRLLVIGGDAERIPSRIRPGAREYSEASGILPMPFTVEEAGDDEFFGMTVDGNHLFLIEGFMVQRNSGKSTLTNTLITFISPDERIISIEDVPELRFPNQDDHHSSIVNNHFTYNEAIIAALRQRPDRIIIGECRFGRQALEMLKSWNTGHPGGITTIHANSADEVFTRLDQLCSEVSVSSQLPMIRQAVDVVIHMTRTRDNVRKIDELLDVRGDRYIR